MKRQLWYFCVVGAFAGVFALSTPAQQKKQPADLIIAGGTVVTMDADRRVLEDGAIAAKGDVILEVGTRDHQADAVWFCGHGYPSHRGSWSRS